MEKNKQQLAVEWLFHLMPPEYKMKQSALDAYGQALEIEKGRIEVLERKIEDLENMLRELGEQQ
jgi:hypothetical protein